MSGEPMARVGGTKFVVAITAMVLISLVAALKGDALAFGSIALVATGYMGANSYITGKYAGGDK